MTETCSSGPSGNPAAADTTMSAAGKKNVSDFCDRCEPFDCMADYPPVVRRHNIFMDRLGVMWVCSGWKSCEHSVILNGKVHSCRVRGKQITDLERGRA